jgi:hypothetical protein
VWHDGRASSAAVIRFRVRARNQIEDDARRYETGVVSTQQTGVIRIPVVVHVVWNTAAQNISDAQVASQIDVLNRDFRRTNLDFGTTPAAYLPLATDASIEFQLATSTPGGVPSNGIERRQTTVATFDQNDGVKSPRHTGLFSRAGNHGNPGSRQQD